MTILCTFRLNDESQERLDMLHTKTQALLDATAALPPSEAELLKTLLEGLLSLITDLSECLVSVEGDAEFETTGTSED